MNAPATSIPSVTKAILVSAVLGFLIDEVDVLFELLESDLSALEPSTKDILVSVFPISNSLPSVSPYLMSYKFTSVIVNNPSVSFDDTFKVPILKVPFLPLSVYN